MSLPQSSRTLLALCCAIALMGQAPPPQTPPVPVPPGFGPRLGPQQPPTQPQPQAPAPAQPPAAAPQEAAPAPRPSTGGLNLQNASLTEVVDILARQLRINYILDSRVRGGVVLNTYGEVKQIDTRALLDSILRINGAAMVQVGDLYRIVPLSEVARLPVQPRVNAQEIPDSDQAMLNLIFLKYVGVEELSKLLDPFVGEHGKTWAYSPANLLLILDSSRNMRRLMELVALFDNDALASQRVRLFDVKNGRPSDIAKELETIIKSISLNEKTAPIKFLPVDRINMIIAVASNPGAFDEVAKWVEKLDTEIKVTAGTVDNFVYRVKYGRAEMLATAIMALYGGFGGFGFGGMGGYGMGMGMGMGGYGMGGGYGTGGYGMGGYGMGGGYGGGGYGMGGYGGYPGGGMYPGAYGGGMMPQGPGAAVPINTPPSVTGGSVAVPPGAGTDLTGQYLGLGGGLGPQARIPRVIPNPMDNTLLIQATQKEYEGILKILRDIDVSPRQVLIDAKIYEVSLTGAFASGVTAFLFNPQGGRPANTPGRPFSASLVDGITTLTAGWLVAKSKELLGQLTLAENESTAKVISQPSIIATDSIAASINVGTEVPTLTASVPTSVQTGGNSIFAQQIQSRNSGVSLSITARVNPSGIVTLQINQEVSSPIAPAAGSIQSPSFSKRTVQTQVTVQDGDTIAIGGIINESDTGSSAGVPGVHKVPVVGFFFGNKSKSKERTELVIFMTPRVIYDTNEISDASDELKSRLRRLTKLIKE